VAGPGPGVPTNAVPPNYRQLVARALAEKLDPARFRDARISAPVMRNVDIISGEQPTVCVTASPVNFGERIVLYDGGNPAWIFLFENGQVSKWFAPVRAVGCRGLEWSPFPEFGKRI